MSFEQLTIILEQSGLPSGTLLALFVSMLILSPLPRYLVVLGALRVGFRGFPSIFVCFGLALLLTFFQIQPLLSRIGEKATELSGSKGGFTTETRKQFMDYSQAEWRQFMDAHTQPKIRERFAALAVDKADRPEWTKLSFAFFISELDRAFRIALVLLLPLLVIDLLTGTAIAALGIENFSADTVSFTLKLVLVLSTSGWTLIGENLLKSYG